MTDTQLAMFPGVRRTDPSTSHDAAGRVAIKAQGWARQVLDCLGTSGAYTDDEICRLCNVPTRYWPSMKSARSRLYTKCDPPLVVPTGEIRDGQQVWRRADGTHTTDRRRRSRPAYNPEPVPDRD